MIANAILNDKSKAVEDMTSEEKKAREDLITSLIAGIAGASGGDAGSAAAGMQIVQENNGLSTIVKASEKALETCVKNTTCRANMNQMGVTIGLTNAQIEEAMKVGATRDPALIAQLTPEQIEYLDKLIRSGNGMSGLILGKVTWGDRLNLPTNTGGTR
ncbi:hypothetical protein SOASR030_35420 [Leminorella grimontii]|uniref:Toxin CdiA n=1 Tax=Leminorella grimontii TaxID=82981 RepID=A0AAV5N616_9GAMM|nr:hypothetical protein [Leminorella grimontii]KFC94405.1 hypothetical protein GLGR_2752 [Leminorella grimontii ATCC 33999 = DSM 5078]GKX57430.1 hypothetical protein SOASR030_35420 [Leminorella grimontii]VFS54620.1 Uncharacterised protein [Leminorella grimontii]